MSSGEKHKLTWFERDDFGRWQWQGFEDQLDTEEKISDWYETKSKESLDREERGEPVKEVFIIDLENATEMLEAMSEAVQELDLLKEWLNDVVGIEKITVEEEFDEFCKRKLNGDENDEDGEDKE